MIKLPQTYGQQDTRWKTERLGDSNVTIGNYGCAITSLSLLCNYIGNNTDPSKLNTWLVGNKGYSAPPGNPTQKTLVIWSKIDQYTVNKLQYIGIAKNFSGQFPQLAEVDLIPQNSKHDQHFVVMLSQNEGFDPWENRIRPVSEFGGVKSYRLFDYESPVVSENATTQGGSMNDKDYRDKYYTTLFNTVVKLSPPLDLPVPEKWADDFNVLESYAIAFTDRVTSRLLALKNREADLEMARGTIRETTQAFTDVSLKNEELVGELKRFKESPQPTAQPTAQKQGVKELISLLLTALIERRW